MSVKQRDIFTQEVLLKLEYSASEIDDGTVLFEFYIKDVNCGGGSNTASGALRGAFESLLRKFNEEPRSVLDLLDKMRRDAEDMTR